MRGAVGRIACWANAAFGVVLASALAVSLMSVPAAGPAAAQQQAPQIQVSDIQVIGNRRIDAATHGHGPEWTS